MSSIAARRAGASRASRRSIRVVVVSADPLLRDGLVSRLGHEPELDVLVAPNSERDVEELVPRLGSCVVIIDVEYARPADVDVLRSARSAAPKSRVVALVPDNDAALAARVITLGASACVPKVAPVSELINAIRWAAEGAGWVSPRLMPMFYEELQRSSAPELENEHLARLTRREREVLSLMVEGLGKSEIAARLVVSEDTVRTHMRSVLDKLEVHSATAAVSIALAAGLRPSS